MHITDEIDTEEKIDNLKADIRESLPPTLHFNSYRRMEELLVFCHNASEYYQLSDHDLLLMQAAVISLFKGLTSNYTEFRQAAADETPDLFGYFTEVDFKKVKSMIHATSTGGDSLLDYIVHDAWWSFVGKKKFSRKMELLRLEKAQNEESETTAETWQKECLATISAVKFYTEYAIETYGKKKDKNLLKISGETKEKTNKKRKKHGRGVETMYRAVYRNHINLSSIADAKANMMISINTIIMSVIITGITGFSFTSNILMQRLQYVIPIFVLLVASLVSVVFAIMSARPEVTSKEMQVEKFKRKQSSYLFFGNFVNMALSKFIERLGFYRTNQTSLYDDMSIDIYHLGKVLDKKYKLLRVSYNLFMIGLISSVLSFIAVMVYVKLLS